MPKPKSEVQLISDEKIKSIVQAWNQYAETRPTKIRPADILKGRDLNMYRGLGVKKADDLSIRLVRDRTGGSLEMTMGHLYERALEELGPVKLDNKQKKQPGHRGIDFIQRVPGEMRIVNLKSGLSTSNSDISQATIKNLTDAKTYWESQSSPDDNPLPKSSTRIVIVRAVARGNSKHDLTDDGIHWMVGEAMWRYFGAGDGFLSRLGATLEKNPMNLEEFEKQVTLATGRVRNYLQNNMYVKSDGQVDWTKLTSRFP